MAVAASIGLSALTVNQKILDLIGQNIANANTPGYHRQVASLAVRSTGEEVGDGVEITQIRRMISQVLESALTRNTYESKDVATQLDSLRQVESNIDIGDGSVHDLLEKFFNQLEQLAGQPDDLTQRRVLLEDAQTLVSKLNDQVNELSNLQSGIDTQLSGWVDQVNTLSQRIADLNDNIQRITIQGGDATALSDQRDQAVGQLAELIDVRTISQPYGVVNVQSVGVPIVLGNRSIKLQFQIAANKQAVVSTQGSATPLDVAGGQIHGGLVIRNQILPDIQNRLAALTKALVQNLDAIHATGIGLSGPYSVLYGQRSVTNVNAALSQAGLDFPPHAGSLFVTVTDAATGKRTVTQVNIDPATQSLSDVAAALSAVPNLQAVVNSQNRTLTILAAPGFTFDFAGRLPTDPQNVAITGTAVPQISGQYTGTNNDTYTYSVVGSGTVGVSPNLTLEARNGSGSLLASWNIGQGYEAGTGLPSLNGVSVHMGAGTVNAGDTFSTPVIATADTAGILPALGINSFFDNTHAGSLSIRSDLLDHPEDLAASLSGQAGDGGNLIRLANLRDQKLMPGGATMTQNYDALAAGVGSQVQDLDVRQSAQEALNQQLTAQEQSVSGVDPNEELVRLMQYQKAYQFSARYITVVNDTLNDLLSLVTQ
ncbi:MAG: flagellar hook-associated protein FlgK [Planctomycetes bacterium]|nr:flagellar hook-associated protein FlgK [Planctomycetota bacterium]